jgi:hypothetical protein
MTTITFGNFNTNCDAVDYSIAHILSYLIAGLMISALSPIIVFGFFRKSFSSGILEESSHIGLNQGYLVASSVHMRSDQEIGLR